MNNKTRTQ